MNAAIIRQSISVLAGSCLLVVGAVASQHDEPVAGRADSRYEIWLAMPTWPGLSDLEPTVGGSFKQVGYGIGGSVHWALPRTRNLMLGIEGAVMATDSDIPVFLDELLARDGYLAVSAKWLLGESRKASLDAGLGYHLLDIAQLDTDYYYGAEFQTWEEGAVGPFVGFTWDSGGEVGGLTLGLRAHFVDFGAVQDEDVLGSVVFGRDAGDLTGPMYVVQLGYRW